MDMRVRVGARRLVVSGHALGAYRERVMPAFDDAHALEQLRRVILHAAVLDVAPAWARDYDAADQWVALTDDIAFPVRDGTLVTCLTRGGLGGVVREARAGKRQRRAEQRNMPGVRRKHGKVRRDLRRARQRARDELGAADG